MNRVEFTLTAGKTRDRATWQDDWKIPITSNCLRLLSYDNIILFFFLCVYMCVCRIYYHIFMEDLSLGVADVAKVCHRHRSILWLIISKKKNEITKRQIELRRFRFGTCVADLLPYTEDTEGNTNEFLRKFVEMLLEYLKTTFDRSSKILDFHHPEQLLEILDLTLPNEPQNIDQLLADCRDTLKYQVKTGQSLFSSLVAFW